MKHIIDAQNKKLGRIASQAAGVLLGKTSTSFAKNKVADVKVEIINVAKSDINAKKKAGDTYVTYTGHRGGLNTETLGKLISRKGVAEAFKIAVSRMLPNNKLKTARMKNLTIKE